MRESAYLYGSSRIGEFKDRKRMDEPEAMPTTGKFNRKRGQRRYELTNHLGNVMAVVSDRKIQHTTNSTTVDYFEADVLIVQDYYAFGSLMPGRTASTKCSTYSVADTTYLEEFKKVLYIHMLTPGEQIDVQDPLNGQMMVAQYDPNYTSEDDYIIDIINSLGSVAGYMVNWAGSGSTDIEVVINKTYSGLNCLDDIVFTIGFAYVETVTIDCSTQITYNNVTTCSLVVDDKSNKYKFGFNGKEFDTEWNSGGAMYDYGFRIYDPRIAKFLSVDPLAGEYPWYTPYQFAGNMPIWAIDLDGLEQYIVTMLYSGNKHVRTVIQTPTNLSNEPINFNLEKNGTKSTTEKIMAVKRYDDGRSDELEFRENFTADEVEILKRKPEKKQYDKLTAVQPGAGSYVLENIYLLGYFADYEQVYKTEYSYEYIVGFQYTKTANGDLFPVAPDDESITIFMNYIEDKKSPDYTKLRYSIVSKDKGLVPRMREILKNAGVPANKENKTSNIPNPKNPNNVGVALYYLISNKVPDGDKTQLKKEE